MGEEEDVVEVERVGAAQAVVVAPEDLGGDPLEEGTRSLAVRLGGEQALLGVRDLGEDAARRDALVVDVLRLQDLADEAQLVAVVVDDEVPVDADRAPVDAEQTPAQRVERPSRARPCW